MYRFAPSPTKDLHIDDLQTALFNYICARQEDDKLIIRIEDIDREQNIEGKDQEILEILNLFGITYTQVLYQSKNLKFHRQLGSKLLMDGKAFTCFCSAEIIETKKEEAKQSNISYSYDGTCKKLTNDEVMANETPFVVRIKKPENDVSFSDIIKGELSFTPQEIDDFVVLKVDKTPTYNFACAVDDMLSGITTIIRSQKYISDTPKQELIREYLGYTDKIKYAHLPNILNKDAFSVKWLLEEGFLPSAITNYLLLIGNKTPTEVFTLEEAINWFDLKDISKEPTEFDLNKLKELNRKHIKLLEPLELSKFIGYSSSDIGELAKVYLKEVSTINEIKVKIDTIFSSKTCEDFTDEFERLKSASKDMPYFKEFDEFKAYLSEKSGLKGEQFLNPLRVLLTGFKNAPELSEIYPHIKNYLGEIIR
jgi:glutamyl-tRNA synthetase